MGVSPEKPITVIRKLALWMSQTSREGRRLEIEFSQVANESVVPRKPQ